jgi:hypothetical protein
MITCSRSGLFGTAVLCVLAALTAACDKVPLLAPSGSVITLTASTTALPVNGSTVLIAQVIEASGTPPHSGTQVTFTTTLGTIEPSAAFTNANGQVAVTFKAGTANGMATISAISGGASASGANAVKIAIGTAAVGRVNVAASPSLIPALGGSSTITTTVFDINGNALPSAPVSYSTTAGTLDPTFGTTDANGTATTVLRTSTKATITASVGAQGSTGTTPPTTGGGTTTPTTGQATGSVTVDVAGAPSLVITPPQPPGATSGLPATFSFVVTAAATNGSAIRDLTVNWGDGTTQDLGAVTGTANVSHTYRSAGVYTVTGTVVDGSGNVVTVSTSVTVNQTQLLLTITPPATPPTVGLPATFTIVVGTLPAGDSVRNVHLAWGDGSSQDLGALSGSSTVSHVYQSAGSYNISGTLTDTAGNSITVSTAVIVNATQVGLTITAPATAPSVGLPASFTFVVGTLPPGDSVRDVSVDWGDGKTQSLGSINGTTTVSHVYLTADTFTIRATLFDTVGNSTTVSTAVTVVATSNPTIIITPTVPVGHPADVTFQIQVTAPSGVGITRAIITFGDGQSQDLGGVSGTVTLHHTYTAAGSYPVTLTVTDTLGRNTQGTASVTIS